MDTPPRFSVLAADAKKPVPTAPWWQGFKDPVLDELVSRALRDNIRLNQARRRVDEAEALALTAVPFVDVNGRVESQLASSNVGDDRSLASATGFATFFGPRKHRIDVAQARVDLARAERDGARLLLLSNLISAYIDLRFVQERLALKQRERQSWLRTLRDLRSLQAQGATTRLDIVQPKAALAVTEAEIANLFSEITRQKNRIATLLGAPAGVTKLDLGYGGQQPMPHFSVAAGVPADLISNRPDIRSAERNYRVAVAEIGVAEALRYPTLTLSGTVSVRSDTDPVTGGLGVLGANIPIFDQGGRQATVTAREIQANIAFLEWKARVLAAIEEVETLLASMGNTEKAISASRQGVALNSEAVSLARKLLRAQEISVLDFVGLQRNLLNAQADLAQNRRQAAANYVALQLAVGAGSVSTAIVPAY